PVPGYDRHFTLAESLGFELLSIPMDDQGPVIAEAQRLADDPAVKGMWLVPMYSNPTGITITEQRARELAALPTAAVDFTLLRAEERRVGKECRSRRAGLQQQEQHKHTWTRSVETRQAYKD